MELSWTAPTKTTDGLDLTAKNAPTTVEICRDTVYVDSTAKKSAKASRSATGNVPEPSCTAVLHFAGHAGPSTATDRISPGAANANQELAYRVRVLNRNGHAAAPSPAVLLPGGPPVPPVEDFRATQQKSGVLLEWRPQAVTPGEVVEIVRTSLNTGPAAPPRQAAPSRQKAGPPAKRSEHEDKSPEVRLRAATGDPGTRPGGMLDQGALLDRTYTYAAERVRTLTLGGKQLSMRSEPTPLVTLAMRDTFPPEPPRGLASIPGTIPATTPQGTPKLTIDLSWQSNIEVDLAGYNVYRSVAGSAASGSATPEQKLNSTPTPGPAYRDTDVVSGTRYQYRVTAVDQRGNESKPGAPVTDSPEGR